MSKQSHFTNGQKSIVQLPNPWDAIRKAFAYHGRDRAFVKAVNSQCVISDTGLKDFKKISGNYLVSGDRGVHAVVGGRFLQLSKVITYGIAVRNGMIWCASSCDRYSSICRAELPEHLMPGQRLAFEEIHRAKTSKKGRYHQIGFIGDRLAIAASENNVIRYLDPMSGEILSECLPFRDSFGEPIGGDHNHINSLSESGECVLFCAYKAGQGSLLCVLNGNRDRVKGYEISSMGLHDIYIEGENLWFSDTFGLPTKLGGDDCGHLMKNNCKVDAGYFSAPPGKVIRGIAGTGKELLVGHSHKGPRAKRYKGKGSIIRLVGEKVVEETSVPFAQVYDILRLDGRHFDEPPALGSWDEINARFVSILGSCVYEQVLG